ncbi:unnamed protein product [Caenorhabditis sp. 36 PRJEB53466]|nr:unnamed protein product [Caenorhabditis sp. 36 PRJEB53466]
MANLEKDLKEVDKIGKLYFKGSLNESFFYETVATLVELTAKATPGTRTQVPTSQWMTKAMNSTNAARLPQRELDPSTLNKFHQMERLIKLAEPRVSVGKC